MSAPDTGVAVVRRVTASTHQRAGAGESRTTRMRAPSRLQSGLRASVSPRISSRSCPSARITHERSGRPVPCWMNVTRPSGVYAGCPFLTVSLVSRTGSPDVPSARRSIAHRFMSSAVAAKASAPLADSDHPSMAPTPSERTIVGAPTPRPLSGSNSRRQSGRVGLVRSAARPVEGAIAGIELRVGGRVRCRDHPGVPAVGADHPQRGLPAVVAHEERDMFAGAGPGRSPMAAGRSAHLCQLTPSAPIERDDPEG